MVSKSNTELFRYTLSQKAIIEVFIIHRKDILIFVGGRSNRHFTGRYQRETAAGQSDMKKKHKAPSHNSAARLAMAFPPAGGKADEVRIDPHIHKSPVHRLFCPRTGDLFIAIARNMLGSHPHRAQSARAVSRCCRTSAPGA